MNDDNEIGYLTDTQNQIKIGIHVYRFQNLDQKW